MQQMTSAVMGATSRCLGSLGSGGRGTLTGGDGQVLSKLSTAFLSPARGPSCCEALCPHSTLRSLSDPTLEGDLASVYND